MCKCCRNELCPTLVTMMWQQWCQYCACPIEFFSNTWMFLYDVLSVFIFWMLSIDSEIEGKELGFCQCCCFPRFVVLFVVLFFTGATFVKDTVLSHHCLSVLLLLWQNISSATMMIMAVSNQPSNNTDSIIKLVHDNLEKTCYSIASKSIVPWIL